MTCYYITRPQREESVKTAASDKEVHLSGMRSGTHDLPGNRVVRQGFEKKLKKFLTNKTDYANMNKLSLLRTTRTHRKRQGSLITEQ